MHAKRNYMASIGFNAGILLPLRISVERELILHTKAKCEQNVDSITMRANTFSGCAMCTHCNTLYNAQYTEVYIWKVSVLIETLNSHFIPMIMLMMSASKRWTCQSDAKTDTCAFTHLTILPFFFILFDLYRYHWIIYFLGWIFG